MISLRPLCLRVVHRWCICTTQAVLFLFLAAMFQQVSAQSEKQLTVGTMRLPPFVMQGDDGTWSGLSIDLWQKVAKETQSKFMYKNFDYDPEGMLKALERGEIDIAVGAIAMTAEGEERFDFSHPYFSMGLGIVVRTEARQSFLETFLGLFTLQLVTPVLALVGLLISVGALVWLIERRRNPTHFNPQFPKGIFDGIWWAAVTMTTTGYGDKLPITQRGRILGLVWMFASIFCIATFSATLASSFVVGRLKTSITGPADLPTARIGVVKSSTGEAWAQQQGLKFRAFPYIIQASKALQRGEIDALIFERPAIAHMIREYAWSDLSILPQTLAVRDIALALQQSSSLTEQINRGILKVVQRREWREKAQTTVGLSD